MSQFSINYLGVGSATPTLRHQPSSQVVDYRDNLLMIDCGEGAQLAMRRARLKFSRLSHIFISHLHGDHCLGLPGLISTLALQGKDGGRITVHTTRQGAEIFRSIIGFFCRDTPFDVEYSIIDPEAPSQLLLDTPSLTVHSFPLYHRVPCTGFIFREKPKLRHLRGDMVQFHGIPVSMLHAIKAGEPYVTPDGRVIPNEALTTPADPAVSYAYCSDTMYDPRVARAVEGVDTLYHEATYTSDMETKAFERGHSTAAQAARIALEAGARRLVLGHYSKRYDSEDSLLAEARAIFPETIASDEGMRLDLL